MSLLLVAVTVFIVSCDQQPIKPSPNPLVAPWTLEAPLPTGEDLRGIWGSAASDVFAVGDRGVILRFDGAVWQVMPTPSNAHLFSVWGRALRPLRKAFGWRGSTRR